MPFARQSFDDLVAGIGANWRTVYPGADLNLPVSADRAAVMAIAGMSDEDLAYLDWQARQLFPFSNDADYLERWAALKGIYRKASSAAAGTVILSGVPGKIALAGVQLQTSGGLSVILAADAVLDGSGNVTVAATALAGKAGNLLAATQLTFVGTPDGFSDTGTVGTTFAGGADAESDASLRLRFINALTHPSFGGNQDDWSDATLALPVVTAVFTAPATPTPGSVTVYPLLDATRTNGIPVGTDALYRPASGASGTGDQRAILDALVARRPICASIFVTALQTVPIDVGIANLTPATDAVKAAILSSLQSMFLYRRKPGRAFSRSWIAEAVSRAAGEDSHDLVAPASDTAIAANAIAVLGSISYS